ncbi:Zinc finger protein CONSTANS-like [Stylosanthes scabra]|uniref:Zinc finger protein CONSTANS-like n=1 Tax=Stylosanthes scabra TaxID=79078 RepID=A0ABU6TSL2_9FABA|nr:Zinc finger protein CONSTANS-like [Stylosanthes scabra]
MLDEDTNTNTTSWGPRVCDTCRSAPCAVFCRADSAYLCAACDARVHAANTLASRHERVWVCEACERAPAAFLCKADAASLCSSCDADIHSANPLASRHQRVPIGPMYGPPSGPLNGPDGEFVGMVEDEEDEDDDEEEAASWLLLNNTNTTAAAAAATNHNNSNSSNNNQNHHHQQSNNNGFLFGGEVDEYLDLVDCNSCGDDDNNHHNNNNIDQQFAVDGVEHHYGQQQQYGGGQRSYGGGGGDSVVPVQHFQLGLEFEPSNKAGYNYSASISQSVSVSSMEVGVVPESSISNGSIMSHSRPPKGTIDLFSGPPMQMASHLTPMDREARVLRYREKKKTRKFEKTIRYASRKAYAETRPRIKGRFAKRTDVEAEVDQMFSTPLITEVGYGIVPSF